MPDPIASLLASHKVDVTHVEAHVGPTTTLHTYQLGAGTKVSAVTNLAKDIAVAVGRDEVIIHAPVKGTSLVGVEVPRDDRTFPTFAFDRVHDMPLLDLAPLSFPVGVDQNNQPVISSLTKMPHLLIAGQTGAGKSVALTTVITALIAQHGPEELELTLVDPKRVELGMFADAPQVASVITDIDDVADRLDEIVFEMDRRYGDFEDEGVRDLSEWNDLGGLEKQALLPYIVVVIDELADLMVQGKKTVEPLLVRIAQLGRAAGIHLVLATQRPTRDVITGLIKANVPSRWAFTVASTTDSMVVLDQPGASALIGKGDSLWFPAGSPAPERVQAYLTLDRALADVIAWSQEEWPEVRGASPDFVIEDEIQEFVPAEDLIGMLNRGFQEDFVKPLKIQEARDAGFVVDENVPEGMGIFIEEIDRSVKALASVTAVHADEAQQQHRADDAHLRAADQMVDEMLRTEVAKAGYAVAIHADDRKLRGPLADAAKWDPSVAHHKGEKFGEYLAPFIAVGVALGATLFILSTIFGG